ncbi:GL26871 [Drosophila persimilis]|uniref:GL26871 n=1 Tax=Drosophila persimilis TaxID=7234 RepID=B4H2N4_DROPE|nr:GL26871 [Drosophila persimilis]
MGNFLSKPKGETRATKNIGFRQFLRAYKRKHSQMSPGQCMVEAARAWGKLSPAQKMSFVRSVSVDWSDRQNRHSHRNPYRPAHIRVPAAWLGPGVASTRIPKMP